MAITLDGTAGVTTPAIINAGANGVGNIGSSTTYFNTVFAKATSAQYADVAEYYVADADYPVGTILIFGGNNEVTQSTGSYATSVAGTVSENPAYIMNTGLKADHVAAVALLGRVPVRVKGKIKKGDLIVSSNEPGVGQALSSFNPLAHRKGVVVGKALGSHDSKDVGTIEVVVGRL